MELASHFWYADSAKAVAELHWTPRGPNQTLDDTVADIEAKRRAAFERYGRRG
jgi:dihydroflavonol-4-reductase